MGGSVHRAKASLSPRADDGGTNPSGANRASPALHTIRATASQYPPWLAAVLGSGMSLKLVSSNDDRALAIRDHLLHLVRDCGMLECQRDAVRLITLQLDPWMFKHWTPFNDPSPEQAASPGYRHALARHVPARSCPTGSRFGAMTQAAEHPVVGGWVLRGGQLRPRFLGRRSSGAVASPCAGRPKVAGASQERGGRLPAVSQRS